MLFPLLACAVGVVVGFAGSRRLRRPDRAAQAASVARTVGGSLGRRRTLTAPELQRACFSEMVRHVRVDRHGQTRAPAAYALHLHPDDVAVVDEARRWFAEGLATALRTAASDNGWELIGTVSFDIVADPSRHLGVPAASVAGDGSVSPTAPDSVRPIGLRLRRTDTGDLIPLGATKVSIGRSRDRTITVDDERVSRSHAVIEAVSGGWTITDEGSSNGTRIDGKALEPGIAVRLRAGTTIGVGPVDLAVDEVEPTADPSRRAGTRALDDQTRTRISGEVLPPRREPA